MRYYILTLFCFTCLFVVSAKAQTGTVDDLFYIAFSKDIEVPFTGGISGEERIGLATRLFATSVPNYDVQFLTRLSGPSISETSPRWSSDGLSIFHAMSFQSEVQIRLLNLQSSELTIILENLDLPFVSPKWSYDNRYIAASSGTISSDTPQGEILIQDIGNGNPIRIPGWRPVWSPNRHEIVFELLGDEGRNIALVNADGMAYRQLTNNDYLNTNPVWSADGETIYFLSNSGGNFDIYRSNSEQVNIEALTDTEQDEKEIIPSSNGNQIAYTVDGQVNVPFATDTNSIVYEPVAGNSLHIMSIDGSHQQEVLSLGAYHSFQWLPDASGFVFYVQIQTEQLSPNMYSLAWLDLDCLDTFETCSSEDIQLIPDTESTQMYPFDIWMP